MNMNTMMVQSHHQLSTPLSYHQNIPLTYQMNHHQIYTPPPPSTKR